jgi:biopolymer transport protein ExbB
MTDNLNAIAAILRDILSMGGPVVAILLVMSVLVLAVVLAKLWQFQRAGVGQHAGLIEALTLADAGAHAQALRVLEAQPSHLARLASLALRSQHSGGHGRDDLRARLTGQAENAMAQLQSGFRLLDTIAQIAPLLGLFGTVLGMITAFQALQDAGAQVDPSALAGGIWVALLTTAVGLGVAMPASVVLTWFEARVAREAGLAARIIDTALCLGLIAPDPTIAAQPQLQMRHA